ncbi:MAG: radical SAM protein, partial [Candidatus Omnitrophota bacterium]
RFKKTGRVIEEAEILISRFGAEHIYFSDEEFTINKERTLELCDSLAGLGVSWSTSNRVDTLDDEIAAAMKRAGCRYIYLGIETASARIHDAMNKKINLRKIQRGIDLLKKHGVGIIPNFMIGYFGETKESVLDSVTFAKRNDLVYMAPFYTMYPGSRDYVAQSAHRPDLYTFLKKVGESSISPFPATNVTEMSDWKLVYMRNFGFSATRAAHISDNTFVRKVLTFLSLVSLYLYYFLIPSRFTAIVRRYMWPFLMSIEKQRNNSGECYGNSETASSIGKDQ